MDDPIKIQLDNINKRIDQVSVKQEQQWSEIEKLKSQHNGHDLVIQRLAMSIEQMSKELAKSVNELSKALGEHLIEEENERKETIKELKGMGWKIMTGVLTSGAIGFGGIIWAILTKG